MSSFHFVRGIAILLTCTPLRMAHALDPHGDADAASAEMARRPLTVRDTIETALLLPRAESDNQIQFSPDRRRYLLVSLRGDLESNGNWLEFYSGTTNTLTDARNGRVVARLLTTSKARNSLRTRSVRWFGDGKSVAFLFKRGAEPRQVYGLQLETGKARQLTNSQTDVVEFDLSGSGDQVLFAAMPKVTPEASVSMLRNGFAVTNQSVFDLLAGAIDGERHWYGAQLYVQDEQSHEPRKVHLDALRSTRPVELHLAPDGRHAVIAAAPASIPKKWSEYRNARGMWALDEARDNESSPTSVSQYWLVDTKTMGARPMLDAPRNAGLSRVMWAPSGKAVAIGPTFLPIEDVTKAGLAGDAIVSIEVVTGKISAIPVSAGLEGKVFPLQWIGDDALLIGNSTTEIAFRLDGDRWVSTERLPIARHVPRIGLEIRQTLNQSPVLYGYDSEAGLSERLYEVNPELASVTLGNVQEFHWRDASHREWKGTIVYPVGYRIGDKRPALVVQIGYSSPEPRKFSLQGLDIETGNAAQPLANRGIAVLNLFAPDEGFNEARASPREPAVIREGVEAAIQLLAERDLIDPARVGLFGFSRTGWWVQHILTHSEFKFAAANVCDNFDGSYVQYTLAPPGDLGEVVRDIGAEPYGDGLKAWMEQSPGFRTERITAPLRLERDQGVGEGMAIALASWEIFTRMRRRHQPVELYFVPDVVEGEHVLEGPHQQLASRSGTVDWFDFWLNGYEDPNPSKSEQYKRWQALRKLRSLDHQVDGL